jgi:hypothetical protein
MQADEPQPEWRLAAYPVRRTTAGFGVTDWMRWRKSLRHHLRLREPSTIRHDFREQTCGPSSFASLELVFEPSEDFSFTRSALWPPHLSAAETSDLDAAIAVGVYDALQPSGDGPYVADGVAAKCVAIEWDDVGSSQMAFYTAAWRATRQLRDHGTWALTKKP